MAVTLQQIAERAGVSRGTVDRALNNRGRIRPEVEARIQEIAKEMGYQPNRAGRAMAMAKKKLKIGVILQSAETPFMRDVLKGTEIAKNEVESLGGTLFIHRIKGMDAGEVIRVMEELREKEFNGIALVPSDDYLLRQTIDQFVDEYNIPIVTFNADLEDTKRICFVGQDTIQSGRVAAGLLGEVIGGQGQVAVLSGNEHNRALKNRLKGFQQEMGVSFPEIEMLETRYTYDDNWVAARIMEDILEGSPEVKGIYMTGYGESGVCECIRKKGKDKKLKVVANDFSEESIEYLKEGLLNFLIGQDAHVQGYEPAMILFRLLFDGMKPEKELQYTDIVIKTKYNI
ncbi:MAG TPA: LacI family DNA-binding transcriptional regulator [Candidatus Pelethocola excrementipullorum]|nr:LacI family DNA-binding transcriptional regulator [Candidatus Pelethocola excrementipullorum]